MRQAGQEGSKSRTRDVTIGFGLESFLVGACCSSAGRRGRTCGFLKISCRRYRVSEVYRVVCRCLDDSNTVALELRIDAIAEFFHRDRGLATLICAPTLHSEHCGFCSGHSVVEALCRVVCRACLSPIGGLQPGDTLFFNRQLLADLNVR